MLCHLRYFHFSFACNCGSCGEVENSFHQVKLQSLQTGTLQKKPQNKRYYCEKDGSSLFSFVPKNLKSYRVVEVCRECNTKYEKEEVFEEGE